ncbi:PIN domain-containing protein [Brevibacillus composti]|uniref:PIN domain-containing protein n=1 Tax=Brevibacillus composti TaxID=2796470 RepID=A0A7T5EII8_9BACL|nr:PIN domain-containing protein [Brevibacillus composti]QQE73218.1 PIN domain-containing protein [Brevibacillus composti]QUO40299.1 PIN domain-containing protein [Brevibacillus composti]
MDGYLFDTNIAIALLAGEHAALEFVRQAKDDRMPIYFSVITECEVFSGLDSEFRLQGIKLFNSRRCIEVSSSVARLAGDIRREQRSKGRKLKTPDAIIIATSIEHQLGLVSRDHDMSFVREAFGLPLFTI